MNISIHNFMSPRPPSPQPRTVIVVIAFDSYDMAPLTCTFISQSPPQWLLQIVRTISSVSFRLGSISPISLSYLLPIPSPRQQRPPRLSIDGCIHVKEETPTNKSRPAESHSARYKRCLYIYAPRAANSESSPPKT
jgi:hypothetical protein